MRGPPTPTESSPARAPRTADPGGSAHPSPTPGGFFIREKVPLQQTWCPESAVAGNGRGVSLHHFGLTSFTKSHHWPRGDLPNPGSGRTIVLNTCKAASVQREGRANDMLSLFGPART